MVEQAPKQLRDHLNLNAKMISGFSQVVEAIYAYFSSKKAHVVDGLTPDKYAKGGVAPMDVDGLGKGKDKGKKGDKGGTGKGKDDYKGGYNGPESKGGNDSYKGGYKGDQSSYQGTGKGKKGKGKTEQFQSNCNFCGNWGHRASGCRRNPKKGASCKPVNQLGVEEESWQHHMPPSATSGPSTTPIKALVQTNTSDEKIDWMMALNVAAVKATGDGKRAHVMIDSGSAITGCPLSFGSHVDLEVSDKPLNLTAVSGASISHHGSRAIRGHAPTSDGDISNCLDFEVCDIVGPVSSVAKINDNGFMCVFPKSGDGPALAVRDGIQIPFSRENNLFLMDFFIDQNLEQWNTAEHTIAPLVDNEELFNEMMHPFDYEEEPDVPPGQEEPDLQLFIAGEGEPNGPLAPVQASNQDQPSVEDIDEHELLGHIVYKAWCPECVLGRGREKQHQRTVRESEVPIIIWMQSIHFQEQRLRPSARSRDLRISMQ